MSTKLLLRLFEVVRTLRFDLAELILWNQCSLLNAHPVGNCRSDFQKVFEKSTLYCTIRAQLEEQTRMGVVRMASIAGLLVAN